MSRKNATTPKATRTLYSQEAVERCRQLYCKYGGKNLEAIEFEMRRDWPKWQRAMLFDRGQKKNARLGWVTKFGFDNSLKIYTQKLVESINDDEQDLYLGIRTIRKELQNAVSGKEATKDQLYQYRDFCKLEIEARRNLDLSRDNFETFVAGYEKLINWLAEIDSDAAKKLIANGEKLIELAQAHYGKQEEEHNGTSSGEDAGGE
ncbi:MAG: hypothetical protein IPN69_08190 [Acidobacteria bacterium]|nr:hypothetical protein [Acidobacteriota bacterium]